MMTPSRPSSRDCPYRTRDDVGGDYVAGRLSPKEAVAFEEHYFSCEPCWAEVRRAAELNRAFVQPVKSAHRRWPWLAAAAVLALAAVGLFRLDLREGGGVVPPAMRGEDSPLRLAATARAGALELEWAAVPRAEVYLVRVFSPDGNLLLERETSDTRLSIATDGLVVRVEALDELRHVVRRSDLVRAEQR